MPHIFNCRAQGNWQAMFWKPLLLARIHHVTLLSLWNFQSRYLELSSLVRKLTVCYVSYGDLVAWRYGLHFSILLLVISVGRDWNVDSILEFSAMKNLRIISDMERVFRIVLFRIASLVFLIFTPSVSSLVRNWFVCREPRTPVVKLICVAF